jgi:Tol biopolymer transport system component
MRRPVVIAALALLAAFPASAGATWPGQPGKIGYYGVDFTRGVGTGVYTIGADGEGNRRIVRRARGTISWSRDGQRIAFFRGARELWEVGADGSEPRRIARLGTGAGSRPAWSPSGRRLLFTRSIPRPGPDRGVWVIDRAGGDAREVTAGLSPTWSSRGLIGFATRRGDVATIRPNGRGRRIWVPQGSPVVVLDLDFSPDGRRLLYVQYHRRLQQSSIRTIDLRTGRTTSIRDRRGVMGDVVWAPGGRRLAYVHGGSGPDELRTVRPSGRGSRTIFRFPSFLAANEIAWQTR